MRMAGPMKTELTPSAPVQVPGSRHWLGGGGDWVFGASRMWDPDGGGANSVWREEVGDVTVDCCECEREDPL